MSIRYSVRPCDNRDLLLIDHDGDEDYNFYYHDEIPMQPRGRRSQNNTMIIKVCNKNLSNSTQSAITGQNITTEGELRCKLKRVRVASPEEEIPQDILNELGGERGSRQRRQTKGNWTDGDIFSGATEYRESGMEIEGEIIENRTDTGAKINAEEMREMPKEKNDTVKELEQSNEILLDTNPLLNKKVPTVGLHNSQEVDRKLMLQNHIQTETEQQMVDLLDLDYNYSDDDDNNATQIDLSLYDDYSEEVLLSVCLCVCVMHVPIRVIPHTTSATNQNVSPLTYNKCCISL